MIPGTQRALPPTFTTQTFLHELLMRNVNNHTCEKHIPLLLRQ